MLLRKKLPLRKISRRLIVVKEFMNVERTKLFSFHPTFRTRSSDTKPKCGRTQLDSAKYFFTNDVVKEWNKILTAAVHYNNINSFKNKLELTQP